MNGFRSRTAVAAVATAAVAVGLADPVDATYVSLGVAVLLGGLGLVVVTGWGRQVNLAQYGFMGVGAYAAAYAGDLPFGLQLVAGAGAAALVAVPVGLAASRLQGLALGALTLVVGLTFWSLARSPEVMSRIGGDTFSGATVDRPSVFAGDIAYALFALAVGAAALVAVVALRRTRTGSAIATLGAGERVLGSLGYEGRRLVILGFALSAGFAGLGGVVLAGGFGGVNANDIVPFNSVVLFAFLAIAGATRPAAAVLVAVLIPVTAATAVSGYWLPMIGGAGLVLAGSSLSDGLLPLADRVRVGVRRRAAPVEPAETAEPAEVPAR